MGKGAYVRATSTVWKFVYSLCLYLSRIVCVYPCMLEDIPTWDTDWKCGKNGENRWGRVRERAKWMLHMYPFVHVCVRVREIEFTITKKIYNEMFGSVSDTHHHIRKTHITRATAAYEQLWRKAPSKGRKMDSERTSQWIPTPSTTRHTVAQDTHKTPKHWCGWQCTNSSVSLSRSLSISVFVCLAHFPSPFLTCQAFVRIAFYLWHFHFTHNVQKGSIEMRHVY